VTSLQAHLLISANDLAEPFTRSVVLLVRHNEDGALGLILNRRTKASLKDAWDKLSEVPCHRDESLFLGGPCEGPLVALHSDEFLSEMEVMGGLYFCAGKEKLERLAAKHGGPPIKFFAGYSGWSPGQLEEELARGSWSVLPALAEHVFLPEDELWPRMNRQVVAAAWRDTLHIKHAPSDPSLN
jgi:putative transcriptional regulator